MLRKIFIFIFTLLSFIDSLGQNIAPILIATGNQIYCPLTSIPIVSSMSITDPDDLGIDAIYIQISSGYVFGEDILTLTGINTNINSNWNATQGKLTLVGISIQPTYTSLIQAIENVRYSSSNPNPSGIKRISITVGQANYLPSNGHYYEYVSNIGITWTNAKTAAANRTYYGLQGYLATITAADEAQLSGEQAPGAGWIGGSDEDAEGVWRWKSGPENGLIFWNGTANGSSPNFAFWNTGEPNNFNGNESYAHITAPGVGIPGSWNDLKNEGEPSGNYQPKGYVVEYGGMPGDPILQIATSTTITIPSIISVTYASSCNPQIFTLEAVASNGTVQWYENSSGGSPIATGSIFTTPLLNVTTTFYVNAFPMGCINGNRTPITATINNRPIVTVAAFSSICEGENSTINVSSTAGIINWFDNEFSIQPIFTGNSFTTPSLFETTTYYLEGDNNGCLSNTRLSVIITVKSIPEVTDQEIVICENELLTLDATTPNVTYLWSTSETTESIIVSETGSYQVILTTTENCSVTKTFTVIANSFPILDAISVVNSTATISYSGTGTFEFSLDGINYQNSNVFPNLYGGEYTAYIRSKEGCGLTFQNFIVLGFPTFFTPNNDGYNDTWQILGMSFYPDAEVSIFNRYGQLITILNQLNFQWDGTFNGNPLASSDYWYVFKLDNVSPLQKGHFSLKR